ncbi:type II toxin-antitoxin system Phd/YefM family antitoxin [Arthrobacter sp. H14]|uniref:type II toxin-antitoxin system Phd/YefM family antitoxin n=1 Tax=Arthrobacter sp. H14 TaxID=1312959 RepID=UPI000479867C|nr:type II toxin-antitoxin system prevent-host-death family antitoxin [Arthrobacter sp. H14]
MESVGLRELKNHLSAHISQVKNGGTVTVTEHGHPVARIVPIEERSILEELIESGVATPPVRGRRTKPHPLPANGTVSDLVAAQRR